MKKLLLTMTSFILSTNLSAQALSKNYEAVKAGDYAIALNEWKALALQSDTTAQFILLQKYRES